MATFVAMKYDGVYKALEVRLGMVNLQQEYLSELKDAVVAVRNQNGKVKLHQSVHLTAAGAASGGSWGLLIGLIFLNPLLSV